MTPQIVICSKIPLGLKSEYIAPPIFTGSPEHLWTTLEATIRLPPRGGEITIKDRQNTAGAR